MRSQRYCGAAAVAALCSTIFALSIAAADMTIRITADNYYDLYVNDEFIDGRGGDLGWQNPGEYSVPLRSGKNVVAVLGEDGGGGRGVLAEIILPDGSRVVTSSEWKVSSGFDFGWFCSNFDDNGWGNANEVADAGGGPWSGRVNNPPASPAKWIWRPGSGGDDKAWIVQFRHTFIYGEGAPDASFSIEKQSETSMSIDVSAASGEQHAWDFGDGATGTGSSASHTYSAPGLYMVTHEASGGGATSECGMQVLITGEPAGYATLRVSGDNMGVGYVNGILVCGIGNWKEMSEGRKIPLWPGENVIAVQGAIGDEGGGLVGEATLSDGRRIGTTSEWKGSENVRGQAWFNLDFDDSNWESPRKLEDYGTGLRARNNSLANGSPADWVWGGNNKVPCYHVRKVVTVQGDISSVSPAGTKLPATGLHIEKSTTCRIFTPLGRMVDFGTVFPHRPTGSSVILTGEGTPHAAGIVITETR